MTIGRIWLPNASPNHHLPPRRLKEQRGKIEGYKPGGIRNEAGPATVVNTKKGTVALASAKSRKIRETFVNSHTASTAPIDEQRQGWEDGVAAVNARLEARVTPVEMNGVGGEWVEQGTISGSGVMLFFHGGGYNAGSSRTHRAIAARLSAATELPVLLVDYRLAPEHPFPAGVEDATTAYRWLLGQGYAPASIVVGGDSAGGGLAAALLVNLRDQDIRMPGVAVLISPWLDLHLSGASMDELAQIDPLTSREGLRAAALLYAPPDTWEHPLASPIRADLHGLPPTLVQVGGHEVLRSDSERWAERARAAGSVVELEVWDEMWHVWHGWADDLPEGREAIARIGEWVREQLRV